MQLKLPIKDFNYFIENFYKKLEKLFLLKAACHYFLNQIK